MVMMNRLVRNERDDTSSRSMATATKRLAQPTIVQPTTSTASRDKLHHPNETNCVA